MPPRRILYIDNTRLSAYKAGGGTVVLEGTFVNNESGLAACGDYLKTHSRSLFMVLADVAEEGFQLEDIPYSSGKDRAAIIKRKLGQNFYGTPFALAISQGRQKTGRRDEHLMMLALTHPQTFEPWLTLLQNHRAILSGLYSLPQLITQLLPKDGAAQQLLLVQTRSGLRQAYFANQQLRFSRLTPLTIGSPEEFAVATVLEAGKMHQYLASQRLLERNQPLATRVLVHPAQMGVLRERCRDSNELRFEFINLLDEAKRAGLNTPLTDSHADTLLCHLLARKSPPEQFAPPEACQHFRLWQLRFALKAVSAVICVGGLLFAAKQGFELLRLNDTTQLLQQQTRSDQQRYDAVMQSLPKIPVSIENLRALVDRYEQVDKRAQGPTPLLVQLSHSLDVFPGIAIDRLDWKVIEALTPPAPLTGSNPPPPPIPIPPEMAQGPYAEVVVAAQLPIGMAGNHRGQLTLVAEFIKHLGTPPNTLATLLQAPVDTQSGQTLKSGEESRRAETPRFSFRLIRKL
jgi:hypothetical protein